jgi:hypothetical protein
MQASERGHARPSVSHLQPGLAPDRSQGVVDGAPTGAAGVGAEATMADPAGPMTFRCPLAVRSTCPPARCTAAKISLASLERHRFGVACCFSAIPDDLSIPRTRP